MYLDCIDITGRCVCDVGGFFGETALYFSKFGGASKVFVYEPLPENCRIIERNVKFNHIDNIYITEKGVSSNDGVITITSDQPPGTSAFGGIGSKYTVDIAVESWGSLITKAIESDVYLIKSDCEGAEVFLLETDSELVSKIPNFIIEIHSLDAETKLDNMFSNLGFQADVIKRVAENIVVKKYSQEL